MKKRIFISAAIITTSIVLLGTQLSRFAIDTSLHNWHQGADGYQQALLEQQRTGKPLAVFFYTDWCSSCKQLRENVLASDHFERYKQQLIAVKINPEFGQMEKSIAKRYGVIGYPTFVIAPHKSTQYRHIQKTNRVSPEDFVMACSDAMRI